MLPVTSSPVRAEEKNAASDVETVDLFEVIKLQKEQIADYKELDLTRQEQIDQLNKSLNECREDINSEIDSSTKKAVRSNRGAIAGYVTGLVGIVFGATVYALQR
jgi:hypothetical protein